MARRRNWQEWPWEFVAAGSGDHPRVGEICEQAGFWYVRLSGARSADGTAKPAMLRGPYPGRAAAAAVAEGWAGRTA